MNKRIAIPGLAALTVILLGPGVSVYYEYQGGEACGRCHEIWPTYATWLGSSHRNVPCHDCHGDALTADVSFHMDNLRRVITHVRGQAPGQLRLRSGQVWRMMNACRRCHRQEYAKWQSGAHSATYSRIFLDKEHNSKELLVDDCLRCHGAHFDGGIHELVTPVDTKGPWRLVRAEMADMPVIPCMSCHQMHRDGKPMMKPTAGVPSTAQEINRPSLALFDRRTSTYYAVATLPIPAVLDTARPIKLSRDERQALCYQCHAAEAGRQVNSGDDRTPVGVHEGLSCLACHQGHSQQTRSSCAMCHPRLSNCGLDVEKMDTTFRDRKSKHNIHFVKCADCHPKGVPRKKESLVVKRADLQAYIVYSDLRERR